MSKLKRPEETPTMVIRAPLNYENTHELAECPLCNAPNPYLDMHLPVREYGSFDMNLYICETVCTCNFSSDIDPITNEVKLKPHNHKFSVKHELFTDADNLKILR